MNTDAEVLVVGGGPAGAACAYWLAHAGHDVLVLERKRFPRDKTCGDGLTPRAVRQLADMGVESQLAGSHRCVGLRARAHDLTLELRWPKHPVFPDYGYVVRRRDLDQVVAGQAVAAGATVRQGLEVTAPLVEHGLVRGVVVKDPHAGTTKEVRSRYVVAADGANSRFGRALGAARQRSWPYGMAIRGYFRSPCHDDQWIESALDVRDRQGACLPGYGWIFPVGDGTINVGVGLLSTFHNWKDVNTSHLLAEFAATAPASWGIDPNASCGPPTGGVLPMGGSVGPKVGPNWMLVGDAAGSINPFNGEGIDYAYETGRLAAELLSEALNEGDARPLLRYPGELEVAYGLYFKVARLFARVIGNPALLRELTRVGMQSATLMEWVLRIMANLLRDDELGPAEAVYRAVALLARTVPESRLTPTA